MADLNCPPVEMSELAWRAIAEALRQHDDPLLLHAADLIEGRINGLSAAFGPLSGTVRYEVTAHFKES